MTKKTVYQCDEQGWFIGLTEADESPLEPGVFHIPRNAFEDAPPSVTPGKRSIRVADQWRVKDDPWAPKPPAVPPMPVTCTPAQGLVALFALKRITEDHILEAIAQISDPVLQYTARIGYQRATSWERDSPTMQTMAQLLQLTEQDLDELFNYASSVNV